MAYVSRTAMMIHMVVLSILVSLTQALGPCTCRYFAVSPKQKISPEDLINIENNARRAIAREIKTWPTLVVEISGNPFRKYKIEKSNESTGYSCFDVKVEFSIYAYSGKWFLQETKEGTIPDDEEGTWIGDDLYYYRKIPLDEVKGLQIAMVCSRPGEDELIFEMEM